MKKYLFLLAFGLPLFFGSCSTNDDDAKNKDELQLLQIRVTSKDIAEPNGNVYLFYVNNYKNINGKPSVAWWYEEPVPYYDYEKSDGTGYKIVPVSDWGKMSSGKLEQSGNGYSVHTIYWNNLSSLYGTPLPGGRYIVCVFLKNEINTIIYSAPISKEYILKKNSVITVHLPMCTDMSGYEKAKWSISGYAIGK